MSLKDKISRIYSRLSVLRAQILNHTDMPHNRVDVDEYDGNCKFSVYAARIGHPNLGIQITDSKLQEELIGLMRKQNELNNLEKYAIEEKIATLEKLEKAL